MIIDKETEFAIYRIMFIVAKHQYKKAKKHHGYVWGFCYLLYVAAVQLNLVVWKISYLTELQKYKPQNLSNDEFWFLQAANGKDGTKRIEILREILRKRYCM